MMPQGMPVRAAHGGNIAQLMSNLGNHYGNGGIVAFRTGENVQLSEEEEQKKERREADREALLRLPKAAFDLIQAPAAAGLNLLGATASGAQNFGSRILNALAGQDLARTDANYNPGFSLTPFSDKTPSAPERVDTTNYSNEGQREPAPAAGPSPQALALLAAQKQKPPRPPAAPAAPPPMQGTPYDRMDATRRVDFPQVSEEGQIIQERMRQDPEEKRRAEIARINEMIGKPDNAAILETIASLKGKREKAAAGADPLMDMLRGIAGARPGQKWWQSGVAGSEYASKMAAQREAADTAYLEQILGHQQKVADTDRAYKTQLYTASSAAADRAAKEVYDAAIASKKSHEEAAKLAQEERIRVMEMVSREKTNAATNAAHITAANIGRGPNFNDSFKADALKAYKASHPNADPLEAIAAVNAALMGTKYTGTDKSYEHEKIVQDNIKARTSSIDLKLQKATLKPEERDKLLERRKEIEMQVRKEFPAPKGEAAAPAASIQSKVEASGQAYEPNKYEYRIAPDGSVQRKAK